MPIHNYRCETCSHRWENLVIKSTDKDPVECPGCGGDTISRAASMASHRFRAGSGGAGGWEHNAQGNLQRVIEGNNTTRYGEGSV